jgi:hypothetical protein
MKYSLLLLSLIVAGSLRASAQANDTAGAKAEAIQDVIQHERAVGASEGQVDELLKVFKGYSNADEVNSVASTLATYDGCATCRQRYIDDLLSQRSPKQTVNYARQLVNGDGGTNDGGSPANTGGPDKGDR